jgi:exodeoxyribonuclease V alpha subunit
VTGGLRDAELVLAGAAGPVLRRFNQAGLLAPADVHTAVRLGRLGGETDEEVLLAAGLAVRAPRVGNVSVDLSSVESIVVAGPEEEGHIAGLPWPEPGLWAERVAASPIVAVALSSGTAGAPTEDEQGAGPTLAGGDAATPGEMGARPLVLAGTHLYLDRYWRDELSVAAGITARIGASGLIDGHEAGLGPGIDAALGRLMPGGGAADQRQAAALAVRRRFTVIAGGPGTGKTTTVAGILALLLDQAHGRPPLIGLAAPTGKAAARLEEAVRLAAAGMDIGGDARQRLLGIRGSTVHRLLGSRPGRSSSFRHDRFHRLPHDVVVVDEASMLSLALMARLVEAVRPDARLVLVGDPEQLVSVEAGAVLADVVGPGGEAVGAPELEAPAAPTAACVARLTTNHRFSGALAELAAAVRSGAADSAIEVLSGGDPSVAWARPEPGADDAVRRDLAGWAAAVVASARGGDAAGALEELARNRVLCAHREGPTGAATWNEAVERSLWERWPGLDSEGPWYCGRPVLVTANDYSLQLFNGDTGVAVTGPAGSVYVAFPGRGGPPRLVGPSRLGGVDTVFAMTVHKSQGSEFDQVTLVLPHPDSRLLTRELLYTALTRARRRVVVVGGEDSLRAAIGRPIARASGLAARLWTVAPVDLTG